MALRAPHGAAIERGNPGPRIEVLPPDELPAPIPASQQALQKSGPRKKGHFIKGITDPAQSMGGKARGRPSLVSTLGLGFTIPSDAFRPYRGKAASFRRAHCAELAQLAGGVCGTGPSSFVASAALQLAVSRYLYDLALNGGAKEGEEAMPLDTKGLTFLLKEARQQADSSRQMLLAAYELAVREGKLRGETGRATFDFEAVTKRAEEEAEHRRLTGGDD